jgi:DNA repair exonuclease SbcCD ATPase subunit
MDYAVCDVYDAYAVVFNFESNGYERAYYIKDDATDSLSIDKKETCYIVDVNENEKHALDMLHQLNGDTYEKVDENYSTLKENVENLEAEKETFSQKIEEHETTIATLNKEKADVENELNDVKGNFENAQATIQTLTEENESLAQFKTNVLKEEKEAVINSYAALLTEETLNSFKEKLDDMTKTELEKELAYALVQSQPTIFTHNDNNSGYVPKDENELDGIDGIIKRYKK